MSMTKRLAAEFFGTFWLVFGGCGSAVLAAAFPDVGIGLLGVALAFGLTVLTMAYAVGPISGGHFNPAVSVGLLAGGRFSGGALIPYVIAQMVGPLWRAGYFISSPVVRRISTSVRDLPLTVMASIHRVAIASSRVWWQKSCSPSCFC